MLIPEEEHDGHRVIQLVHLVEIGNLINVAQIDDGEIFDLVSNTYFIYGFRLDRYYFIAYIRKEGREVGGGELTI